MKKIMLTVLALSLSACGGGSDNTAVVNPTPSPAPTPTPPPAPAEVALFSGKAYYQGTCAACHGPDPTANFNRIRSAGANNPDAIINAFNTYPAMSNLAGRFSRTELTAIASYLADPLASPGGLFVGYYQEDPVTNPEDPQPGALYMALPEADGSFSGKMDFTYFACQNNNVGIISGNKSSTAGLSGNWNGSIDATNQSGTYSGTFDAANTAYSGSYQVAAGKQTINIPNCSNVSYVLAPNGSWNLSPVEKNTPTTFTPTVNQNTLIWPTPNGYAGALISVMDLAAAVTINGANAVKVQSNVVAPLANFDLTPFALTSGKQYLAVVNAFDASRARIGAGSKRFTAP